MKRQQKDSGLSIVDVRIVDAALVPAKYFLEEPVLEELRKAIKVEVVIKGSSIPPGVEPIYSDTGLRDGRFRHIFEGDLIPDREARSVYVHLIIATAVVGLCLWLFLRGW